MEAFWQVMGQQGSGLIFRVCYVIVSMKRNVQQYFRETYGRETVWIPNGVSKPVIAEAREIRRNTAWTKMDISCFWADWFLRRESIT